MAVPEHRHIAVGSRESVDHAADARTDILGRLSARGAVMEQIPRGPGGADVGGGAAFVVAIVPLAELRADFRAGEKPRQLARAHGAAQRAREDERERVAAEDARKLRCAALALRGERKIAAGGVPSIKAPFGLAVSDEKDPPSRLVTPRIGPEIGGGSRHSHGGRIAEGREKAVSSAAMEQATHPNDTALAATARFEVCVATVVFRVVRGELSVGLPRTRGADGSVVRGVPTALPNASVDGLGLDMAAQLAASRAVPVRDLVRISHAGVRALGVGSSKAPSVIHIVSWAIARPVLQTAGAVESVEAEEAFLPIARLGVDGALDATTRAVVACAFDAFLDATLADAVTRRLLPRHVLFRKTDGFGGRSPYESVLGEGSVAQPSAAQHAPEPPLFVGLLPDPFPLSALREFYEHLLGAPLDRGNFRRQFQEIISQGPVKALPIFERGVPHRAGQLFTFDKAAWARFTAKDPGTGRRKGAARPAREGQPAE